jgi:transketolase
MTKEELDQLAINTIRTLSIDAVQQAKSGHPGTPMALAPLVYTLWNRVMRFDPKGPIWPDRDRFVLSNGHASMLLWSVLFLMGTRAVNAEYERLGNPSVTLDDIRHFRQLDSKAPGHPEYHWGPGSRRRPVRWVRASPRASAWRSRGSGLPAATTSPDSRSSITTSMRFAATAA